MKLKQIVNNLNTQSENNNFKLTELTAKRSRQDDREWIVVRFCNSGNWKDFAPGRVELFEALPPGWPIKDVAQRLNCSIDDIKIIARYNLFKERWQ